MTKHTPINVEHDGNEYIADIIISYSVDKNYGADADGNRGVEKPFYDGVEIVDVYTGEEMLDVDLFPELEAEIVNNVAERFMELISE